jgi:catechol 2,3-dioxygenase-like lactoylglutathione lyase family enzyme
MSVVKVTDLAYIRLQSPSLDQAEEFLTHFGMACAERTKDRLYMRGTDPAPYLHITHLGPSKLLGMAFYVEDEQDLRKFSKTSGASGVENLDEPGGGQRVRIADPLGYQMELVCGQRAVQPLALRKHVTNWGDEKLRRAGKLLRLDPGPSQVKRIAHAVLMTQGARDKIRWYREMFGFVPSDEVYAGAKDNIIASFNRCDRGETHVDHHTFLCVEGPQAGLNHLAYEVQNFDDLMLGHYHLKQAARYRHWMGVGRHVIGSQVFDYWEDPWGRAHEHWWDTDRLTSGYPANYIPVEEGLLSQWGAHVPEAFISHASP